MCTYHHIIRIYFSHSKFTRNLPPFRKWVFRCLDDTVSPTEATFPESSAPWWGGRDSVPYRVKSDSFHTKRKRWRWTNEEHESTRGSRDKTRRTVWERFCLLILFFFSQCCDIMSETRQGFCRGDVGRVGGWNVWFIYTLKTFYVSLCKR